MQEIENDVPLRKFAIVIPECLEMLQEAIAYIAENSPVQAEIMHEQFYEKIYRIERMPGIGTIYKNGMRKMLLGKFNRHTWHLAHKPWDRV